MAVMWNFSYFKVDQPTFGINRAFLVNTPHPTRQAYRSLIEQTWPLVYPLPETNYSKIADDILEFETRIAEVNFFNLLISTTIFSWLVSINIYVHNQVTAPPEKRRNRTELYNLMNIREFGEHTVNASSVSLLTTILNLCIYVYMHIYHS